MMLLWHNNECKSIATNIEWLMVVVAIVVAVVVVVAIVHC